MEFRLLGQFELRDGGRTHHLGGPMQRTLLAHLLLAGQEPRGTDDLTSRMWGTTATDGSTSTLQVHVLRLRRLLQAAGCTATIETVHGAYRLLTGANTVDVADFQHLLRQARTAQSPQAELAVTTKALDLWHGELLTGVTGDWPRFPEVRALLNLRDAARARRAELQLALDQPADIGDLRGLVAEHPDREPNRLLLMRALHRAGRRAEALAAYDAAYRYADHLGLTPAAELKELQHRILNGNPAPHALPATTSFFVGRAQELATPPSPVHLITGMPGVGKTALALQLAGRHCGGTLHADLSTTDPSTALARFLKLLQLPVPSDVDERAELFRTHTTGRRVLVLIDDATETSQVRALLPGAGGSALVTSRRPLPALDATRTHLTELTTPQAVELLGKFTTRREPDAARRIAEYCGHLPLAVRIAAGKLAARPTWSLHTLADLLEPEETRLDHLVCEDLSVREAITRATAGLTETQRRALARPHQAHPDVLEQLVDEGLIRQDHTVPTLIRLHTAARPTRLVA